jgi:hypothetical protein
MTLDEVELLHFYRRRQRLNERLDASRTQIDAWINTCQGRVPSMTDIATLEGLLMIRRDTLAELVDLDDRLIGLMLDGRSPEPS